MLSVANQDFAVHDDRVDVAGLGATHDDFHRGNFGVQVGVCQGVQADENHVGAAAGFEAANLVAEPGGRGGICGGHGQHLLRGDGGRVQAGLAVQLVHQPHFLQQVVIVVNGGAVRAHGDVDAGGQHRVNRGDAVLEAQVGAGVMADGGAGVGQKLDVAVGEPNGVGERNFRAEKLQVVQVFHRGFAPGPEAVVFLIGAFHQVHMDAGLVAGCLLLGAEQKFVGVPLGVGRAVQHAHLARGMVVILPAHLVAEGKVVVIAHLADGQVATHVVGQICGQPRQEIAVVLVHDAVLVAKVAGKGHSHTGVEESAQHGVHVVFEGGGRRLGMVVHDGGGTRL